MVRLQQDLKQLTVIAARPPWQGASSERPALQRRLHSASPWSQSMRRTAPPATSVVRGREV